MISTFLGNEELPNQEKIKILFIKNDTIGVIIDIAKLKIYGFSTGSELKEISMDIEKVVNCNIKNLKKLIKEIFFLKTILT